ncbi:hypothetical protein [uncultured Rikenella sp.]|uniref:hypothetical protein n=1 Tax=uncultured Rikenella sp. TaxID=368003 RepID=UPI0025EEB05C|nr:hypothetical protein [uncultured Rikenella sp.]
MKKTIAFLSTILLAGLVSCSVAKKVAAPPQPRVLNLALTEDPHPNRFVELDYGIRLNVRDERADGRVLQKYDASATSLPQVSVNPEVLSFVSENARRYMRTMGFNLDADISTDYLLTLAIREFNLSYLSGVGWSGTVQLNVQVHDQSGKLVYPSVVAVGRASVGGSGSDFLAGSRALNTAYAYALRDIDWDRIAFFLKRSASPGQEKNKQVTGAGNTALESTVIRWYIDSSPKGADVSLRIVSSTPEVKNTNQNFVGSTPYETTETFDVKGLTFNNSGNVQVEVVCEKAGYITQRRRFNLRQAIEQKEISAKFNLVKEEE